MKRKTSKKLMVIAHNLSSYDLHLFIKELCLQNADQLDRIRLLPQTMEKYISLTTPKFRFIDSFRHMGSSHEKWPKSLRK